MYSLKIILILPISGYFSFLFLNLAYFYFFFFFITKFLRKLLFFSENQFGIGFSLLLCFYYSVDCTLNLLFLLPGLF